MRPPFRLPSLAGCVLAATTCGGSAPAAAAAGCAESVHVTWETDLSANRVLAAVMQVRGCADATVAGLELLLDGAPAQALPVNRLSKGIATFDLRPLALGLEAVSGIRVTVQGVSVTLPPVPGLPATPEPAATPAPPIGGVVDEPATGGTPTASPGGGSRPAASPHASGGAHPPAAPPRSGGAPRPGAAQPPGAATGQDGSRQVVLPFSGAPLRATAAAGLVLLAGGLGLLVSSRRRGRPASGCPRR